MMPPLVVVEAGGPLQGRDGGRDGDEATVPHAPGLAPVPNNSEEVYRREPT